MLKMTLKKQLVLWLTSLWLLSGCIPPPKDASSGRTAPVQEPNTPPSVKQPPKTSTGSKVPADQRSEAKDKPSKKNQRPLGLPAGWTLTDPKGIIVKIEQDTASNGVILFTKADAGLEVVGARDASKQDRYRGKLDGGQWISLSPATDKILVLFSNRQNARVSVLLHYTHQCNTHLRNYQTHTN